MQKKTYLLRLYFILRYVLALALFLSALFVRTPTFFLLRNWDSVLIGGSAFGFLLWELRHTRQRSSIALLLCTISVIVGKNILFYTTKHDVLKSIPRASNEQTVPPPIRIGDHFMIGYTNEEEVRTLANIGAIGGIFITTRNIQGKSKEDITAEIARIQNERMQQNLPPLLVATDQEGGPVSRLSPPLVFRPRLNATMTDEEIITYAKEQARELRDLGVTINFAPVIDIPQTTIAYNDDYTRINTRNIGKTPEDVARVARLYVNVLADQHVIATLKHFPGLGRVTADTHTSRAMLKTPRTDLSTSDWIPFQSLATASAHLVMVGHVITESVDATTPASFSKTVIDDVLRKTIDEDSVVVTDDFSMGAVYYSDDGIKKATVKALNAGVDLILIAYDTDLFYESIHAALDARDQGKLDEGMLQKSAVRLQSLQKYIGTSAP